MEVYYIEAGIFEEMLARADRPVRTGGPLV